MGVRTGPNNLDPRLGNDEASQRVAPADVQPRCWTRRRSAVAADAGGAARQSRPAHLHRHLRRGVKFHDGHELTAKDVVYTFGQMLDPTFLSPFKGAYRSAEERRRARRLHRRVHAEGAVPRVSDSARGSLPRSSPPARAPTSASIPIGTGPYRFVRYAVDDQRRARAVRRLFRRRRRRTPASSSASCPTTRCAASSSQGIDRSRRQRSAARHRAPVRERGTSTHREVAGARLLVPRHQHARPDAQRTGACVTRSATRSIATPSSSTCAAASRGPRPD